MTISSVSAGAIVDPNWGNSVADKLNQTDDAYTTFTPTWNNVTIGNATVNFGDYRYVNGDLRVRCVLTVGSTTVITGNVSVDLPNSETARDGNLRSLGSLSAKDGATDITGHVAVAPGDTSIDLFAGNNTLAGNNIDATYPFTWATGDQIHFDLTVAL